MSGTAPARRVVGGQHSEGALAMWVHALGSAALGVWAIRHLMSPLDRRLYA